MGPQYCQKKKKRKEIKKHRGWECSSGVPSPALQKEKEEK
jgi:hypothetical protein